MLPPLVFRALGESRKHLLSRRLRGVGKRDLGFRVGGVGLMVSGSGFGLRVRV